MTGRLKPLGNGSFCVEYDERGVHVTWTPGVVANASKPNAWIADSHPQMQQLPEHMLRDIIGSKAHFSEKARIAERHVDLPGRLKDGGTITIGYSKGVPPRLLMESEQEEGVETVKEWARSYLRNDI